MNARRCILLSVVSVMFLALGNLRSSTVPQDLVQERPGANPDSGPAPERWSLGYWTPWTTPRIPPERIEWGGLTHAVHAWALVKPDGTLDLDAQKVLTDGRALVSAGHARGVKVLLGIAQPYWDGKTQYLPDAARRHRSKLVDSIIRIVDRYDFDGVDIDWEPFNARADGEALRLLARELRSRLGTRLLSAAAIVTDYRFWGAAHEDFDRIGVMTYDMTGTWNPYSWHNAALYNNEESALSSLLSSLSAEVWSIDLAAKRFTQAGVPRSKLSIGIPFFGHEWSGSEVNGPRQHWTRNPSIRRISYQNLTPRIHPDNYRWDSIARVPYLSFSKSEGTSDRFLTYDNEQSVLEKVNYVKSNGLGGWIIWELSGDYFPAQTPSQPLLHTIKNAR